MSKKSNTTTNDYSANVPSMERVTVTVNTDNVNNSANIPSMERAPSTQTSSQQSTTSSNKK